MQNEIKQLIDSSYEHALSEGVLDKETIVKLLELDPESEEALYLREQAKKAALEITGSTAYLWGAIGVDFVPCDMNCKFCSFGTKWDIVKDNFSFTDEEIIEQVKYFVSMGVRFIVLRTTEFYSIDSLCDKIRRIKKEVPGEYDMVLNTGEFNLEIARKMHDAGDFGIYHACRLREGTDTEFDPELRLETMKSVKESPLELISLVEPVGPEHSNEEIADNFLNIAAHDAYVSGTMARVPVKGTPLGDSVQLSDSRIAQITAVLRLAAGQKVKNICVHPCSEEAVNSGANVVVIELGAIPRDDKVSKDYWHDFKVDEAKKLFNDAGFTVSHKDVQKK